MLRPLLRAVPGILVLSILIWASGCPGPGPATPAPACDPFAEERIGIQDRAAVLEAVES